MKNNTLIFVICLTLFASIKISLEAQTQTTAKGRPITLIGFGVPVDVPGSYGDTWATAWSADDSVFIMANDGYGITRGRVIQAPRIPGVRQGALASPLWKNIKQPFILY